MIWNIRGSQLRFHSPLLVGILNVTPDSFSDGGQYAHPDKAVERACEMAEAGAGMLDIGGESTRPGAAPVSAGEELNRILPVLKRLRSGLTIPVSIDTTKPEVARICLEEGAHVINDVSGLRESGDAMAEIVTRFGAGLVLMHRRGDALSMDSLASYHDVTAEVLSELRESFQRALARGVSPEQVVIDPGLGFAKTSEHNLEILRALERFQSFDRPLLLGPSRKSFIGKITGRGAGERGYGTAAVVAFAVMKGVQILRVHDVSAAKDVVRMISAIGEVQNVGSL